MSEQQVFLKQIIAALDDIQAIDTTIIDVKDQTTVTDFMIICSGRSSRHVKSIAQSVMEDLKAKGLTPLGSNGLESGEWALVDFGDFVLHVMQPDSRAFYNLEGLWQAPSLSK